MPNSLSSAGLQVQTMQELIDQFTTEMKAIYGDDLVLTSDTPDSQMMMIFNQTVIDVLDLVKEVYNSMDPDSAIGVTLDKRVAYNGIQRKAGTYTVQEINIETSQALTLFGVNDSDNQDPFTVSDEEGNNWLLIDTYSFSGPTSPTFPDGIPLSFRAENPGAIITKENSITVPVTIVLGVESINNPSIQSQLGIDEESDYELKIRRQKSVSLGSQGYYEGLLAALENLSGVTSAQVYENRSGTTTSDGRPPHSFWVVLSGTPDPDEVANTIYRKGNAGATIYGDISYVINRIGGEPLIVRWSEVDPEDLFITFEVTSIDGINLPQVQRIRDELPGLLIPAVSAGVNINEVAALVRQIDPNTLVTDIGLGASETGPFFNVLEPSAKDKRFIVKSENIIISPIPISPAELEIAHDETRTFIAAGGFGTLTFTLDQDDSGGNVTTGGFYTAGPTAATTDILRVTDELGDYTLASISVV